MSDRWKQCISEAFEDAGIEASDQQIDIVTAWAESEHEHGHISSGNSCIPHPLEAENARLKSQIATEREKVTCPACRGEGRIITYGVRSGNMHCTKCNGEGRVSP